jgi:prophage tail gpP-like protein
LPDVALRIGSREFRGWTEIGVTRSLEAISGTFDFQAVELAPDDPLGREIQLGDACEVLLNGQTVIAGFVDERAPAYDGVSHDVRVGGRDRTGDLVDCSVTAKPGEWHGRKLEQIVADLIAPYAAAANLPGIVLSVGADTGKAFEVFKAEPTETVFAALDRACRQRAILPVSDGQGGLVLTRAGTERIPVRLERGKNILAGSGAYSDRERFSLYRFRGQTRSSDFFSGAQAASVAGEAQDEWIARFRPLVQVAEEPGTAEALRQRARAEAAIREGRGFRAEITVRGWEWAPGQLWEPNRLVPVLDSWLGIDMELLIVGVTYRLDAAGTTAQLSLTKRESYLLAEGPKKVKASQTRAGEAWPELAKGVPLTPADLAELRAK